QIGLGGGRRRCRTQGKSVWPDLQSVPLCQRRFPENPGAVDKRAVAALQVLDEVVAVLTKDLRMLSADRLGVQADGAIQLAAEDGGAGIQRILAADFRPLQGNQ